MILDEIDSRSRYFKEKGRKKYKMEFFIWDEDDRISVGMTAYLDIDKSKPGCPWVVTSPDSEEKGEAYNKVTACLDYLRKRLHAD